MLSSPQLLLCDSSCVSSREALFLYLEAVFLMSHLHSRFTTVPSTGISDRVIQLATSQMAAFLCKAIKCFIRQCNFKKIDASSMTELPEFTKAGV